MAKIIDVQAIRSHIREFASTKPLNEMAVELNVSPGTVSNYAKEMGFDVKRSRTTERTERIKQTIITRHMELTAREIAKMHGVQVGTIWYHGSVMGIEFKPFTRKSATKKPELVEGEFFNESHRENWLI